MNEPDRISREDKEQLRLTEKLFSDLVENFRRRLEEGAIEEPGPLMLNRGAIFTHTRLHTVLPAHLLGRLIMFPGQAAPREMEVVEASGRERDLRLYHTLCQRREQVRFLLAEAETEEEPPSAETILDRYAPMMRLLDDRDVDYLRRHTHGSRELARRTRREHRQVFRGYCARLWEDVRGIRHVRRQQIALGMWDEIRDYYLTGAEFAWHFGMLRAAAVMHFCHVPAAPELAHRALAAIESLVPQGAALTAEF